MTRFDTISFLSDYGTTDEFVGVVHSVIRQIAPHVSVIDISHQIPHHDVRAGGLALARAAQYLAPGVVVAVVDPGVGTARRAIAVEVGDGASILVGPDNGLLAPAVSMVGGATRAVELTSAEFHLPAPGPTFAGRDIFAPVAAHLCNGVDLGEFGSDVDPDSLMPGMIPITREEGGDLVAQVLWTDQFGNLQLNVDPAEVEVLGERIELSFDGRRRTGIRRDAYAEIGVGEIGLVVDSYGLLSLAVSRASAAEDLGIGTGDEVRISLSDASSGTGDGPGGGGGRAVDAEAAGGVTTPVTLGIKP